MTTENGTFSYQPTTSGTYTWSFRMKNSGTVAQPASVYYLDNLVASYPIPYTRIDCDKGPNASYRYGFNGVEKESDMYGESNAYEFKYRMYDARIGKFLSQDPLFKDYPWNSSYAFAENDVIRAKDLEGLEKAIVILRYSGANVTEIQVSTAKDENGNIVNMQLKMPDGKIVKDDYLIVHLYDNGTDRVEYSNTLDPAANRVSENSEYIIPSKSKMKKREILFNVPSIGNFKNQELREINMEIKKADVEPFDYYLYSDKPLIDDKNQKSINIPASQSEYKENVFYKINNSKRKESIEDDINKNHPNSKSTNVSTQATNEGEEKVTRVTLNSKK